MSSASSCADSFAVKDTASVSDLRSLHFLLRRKTSELIEPDNDSGNIASPVSVMVCRIHQFFLGLFL